LGNQYRTLVRGTWGATIDNILLILLLREIYKCFIEAYEQALFAETLVNNKGIIVLREYLFHENLILVIGFFISFQGQNAERRAIGC
jgi:uncharacterized membrane protein (DUF373 family)